MKLTRSIPAGMADAGLASLATFILSLYAIARWQDSDPTILGISSPGVSGAIVWSASRGRGPVRDRRAGAKTARLFGGLTAGAVLGYVVFAGFDWTGNPVTRLVDTPHTVQFLVIVTIVANGINVAAIPGRLGLVGASREKQVFTVEAQADSGQLLAALVLALAAGASLNAAAFAYPVPLEVLGLLRLSGFERALNNHYSTANQPTAA